MPRPRAGWDAQKLAMLRNSRGNHLVAGQRHTGGHAAELAMLRNSRGNRLGAGQSHELRVGLAMGKCLERLTLHSL